MSKTKTTKYTKPVLKTKTPKTTKTLGATVLRTKVIGKILTNEQMQAKIPVSEGTLMYKAVHKGKRNFVLEGITVGETVNLGWALKSVAFLPINAYEVKGGNCEKCQHFHKPTVTLDKGDRWGEGKVQTFTSNWDDNFKYRLGKVNTANDLSGAKLVSVVNTQAGIYGYPTRAWAVQEIV